MGLLMQKLALRITVLEDKTRSIFYDRLKRNQICTSSQIENYFI